jgi:membrane protein
VSTLTSAFERTAGQVWEEARTIPPREAARAVAGAYRDNNLVNHVSAISFQLFFALLPLLLFLLGLLGLFHLDDVWRSDLFPEVKKNASSAAATMINDTVTKILSSEQGFWISAGGLLTLWRTSAAVRAIMRALNVVYETDEDRGLGERLWVSAVVAVGGLFAVGLAIAAVKGGPPLASTVLGDSLVVDLLATIASWVLALALLFTLVAFIERLAPAKRRPLGWVSVGATLAVVSWILVSLAFGFYLTQVASYGSVFGNLATVYVVLQYLFLSTGAFLTGAQLDSLIRERASG